jgi:hypothetical protein
MELFMSNENKSIRDDILDVIETSLEAQLRAIRRLRGLPKHEPANLNTGMSQVDMAYDILIKAKQPLHITEIINRIEIVHQIRVERESLVSAIAKKLKKADRFARVGKNTYEAIEGHS